MKRRRTPEIKGFLQESNHFIKCSPLTLNSTKDSAVQFSSFCSRYQGPILDLGWTTCHTQTVREMETMTPLVQTTKYKPHHFHQVRNSYYSGKKYKNQASAKTHLFRPATERRHTGTTSGTLRCQVSPSVTACLPCFHPSFPGIRFSSYPVRIKTYKQWSHHVSIPLVIVLTHRF